MTGPPYITLYIRSKNQMLNKERVWFTCMWIRLRRPTDSSNNVKRWLGECYKRNRKKN